MCELTIYTCLDTFEGERGRIQRNAIGSWMRLNPTPEILLFGEEPGAREFAEGIGLPLLSVERKDGIPLLGSLIREGETRASHDTLCLVNADIIILQSFMDALGAVSFEQFLFSTRRWDMQLERQLAFNEGWDEELEKEVYERANQHRKTGIDVFCYRGYRYSGHEPGFLYARMCWDNWLVWHALDQRIPFLDAGTIVVHQAHHRPASAKYKKECKYNTRLYRREVSKKRNAFKYTTHQMTDGEWEVTDYGRECGW